MPEWTQLQWIAAVCLFIVASPFALGILYVVTHMVRTWIEHLKECYELRAWGGIALLIFLPLFAAAFITLMIIGPELERQAR